MKSKATYALSGSIGLLCGILSNHGVLRGSWLNLAFWGVAGILIGFFTPDRTLALWAGASYGTVLVLSFLFSGFNGTTDKLLGFSLLALGLAIIGGACGLVIGFLGSRFSRILHDPASRGPW